MLKIVLDTNLLIDGSTDDNNFGSRIINEIIEGKIAAYANRSTLAENRLMARKKVYDENYLTRLNNFFDHVNLIDTQERLNVVEDRDDNKILESAVESGSDYLVTSDNHLLKIGLYEKVKIISPSGFWQAYEESTGNAWKNWLNNFIN